MGVGAGVGVGVLPTGVGDGVGVAPSTSEIALVSGLLDLAPQAVIARAKSIIAIDVFILLAIRLDRVGTLG